MASTSFVTVGTGQLILPPKLKTRTYRGNLAIAIPFYTLHELVDIELADTVNIQAMGTSANLRLGNIGAATDVNENFESRTASTAGTTIIGQAGWLQLPQTGATLGGSLLVRSGSLITGVNSLWLTQAARPLSTYAYDAFTTVASGTSYTLSFRMYLTSGVTGAAQQGAGVYLGKMAGATPDWATDTVPWLLSIDPTDGNVTIQDNTNPAPGLLIATVALDALHYFSCHVTTAGVLTVYVDGALAFTGAVIAAAPTFDYLVAGREITAAGGLSTNKIGWDNILLSRDAVGYDGVEILSAQGYQLRSGIGGMIDLNDLVITTEPGSAGVGVVEILVIGS